MVTLVIVKNPFSPQDGREVKYIEPKGTLADLLEEYKMPGVELQATVNGYTIDDKEINDEDFIVIYPVIEKGGKGGKGILGIIAAVALSVVSFGIASGGWLAGIGIKAGTFAAYAAATAVMFIGSSLMGRLMGQKVDVGGYDAENEPTYSWGGIQTMEGQNNAVALTYGKVKSGGQTIGKFVSTEDNEEYLNWLIACGEGELTITDIKLNENAVENYENVTCEIRSGTNDQAVIPYFNDTYFTKNLSYHMTTVNTWYTDTAQGTATDGLIFKVELPNGLYHGNDEGKFSNNYVDITMQYKLTSSSTWITMAADRINGKSNKAIRKEYRVDNITSGSYDVRMRVTAFGRDDATRDMHEIYWTGITSIVYDDFIYPCQALIGIRAKATDQLSGTPTLTFMKERSVVWVYNPYSDTYITKDATNPAWACYDFVHQARKLKNINTNTMEIEVRGAAKELMRYDDFDAWATWCDDKDYHVNIEINNVGEVLELVNQRIAPIGHGLVVRFGTKYGCIYDHVQTPVQMFGMGNIISGTFQEEFLKVSDRANCVEITFTNKDAGYERDVLTIYGDTYDADGYTKTAQMTFDGITDYEQAYREGKYQLYSNQYLLRTVSFECGIDAIACTVGDVVMVSHDVPKWANSGRIESISGATWVLPVQIDDLTQSYRIQWRTQKDTLYTRACTIVSSADGWTTITVSGTIPSNDPPQSGDVFDLAIANIGSKPFVVKSITRAQDFTRSISCVEYNEAVYNEEYDIPVIDYSQWGGLPQNVENLVATLTNNIDNSGTAKLTCSWDMPDSGGVFTVLISTDGTTWRIAKTNLKGTSCEIDVDADTTYFVKVITLLGVNQSSGTVSDPVYPGGNTLPPATNLVGYTRYRGVKDGEYRYDIHLTWLPPVLSNYQTCDVWYKTNHRQTSQISMTEGVSVNEIGFTKDWEYAGNGYSDFVMNDVVYGDTYRFAVTTRDVLGNHNDPNGESVPTVDVTAAAKSTVPNTPDGFGVVFTNSESIVSWSEVSNADIQFYEVRSDVNPGAETGYLLARVSGTSTSVTLTDRTGTLYLYAKSPLGRYSYPAVLEYSKAVPPKPTAPTLTAKLGGFSLVAGTIPSGCNGMNIYIDGVSLVSVHTVNNTYTHTCDAGIYDVQVAYTDIFGEGAKSAVSRVTVKATVDSSLLEQQAVTKAKLETALQDAVDDAVQSAQDIVRIDGDISSLQAQANGIVTELNKNPAQSSYASITGLKTITDNIISDATTNYNTLSGRITANTTDIQQNESDITALASRTDDTEDDIAALQVRADGIAATVASNKTTQDAWNTSTSSSISTIQQNATSLATTVANNKTTQDGVNSSVASQITQNANGITAITTKLGSAPDATGQYAAIAQLSQSVTGLESQIEEIYEMTDEGIAPDIAVMKSQIQQNSRSIETVVSNLNASASGNTYTSISSLKQQADSIASTVSTNKASQDAINAGTSSSGLKTMIETNTTNITQTANGVSAIVAKLNSATDILDYDGVSALSDEIAAVDLKADGISTTVTNNKTAQDAINAGTAASGLKSLIDTNTTNISQNASDISSVASRVTATENKLAGTATSALLTKINQNASGISSVATRVTTTEGQLAGTSTSALLTKINQNASGISAVVADVSDVADDVADIEDNLNDSTKARSYTALQVMQDGIASKVAMGDVESYLQQDHTGFYIKGSLINIDGDTIIGNNVITRNAIASNAINASKIAAGAVTAAKMSVDSLSAISATIGTLRTATTGARTEIKDNLIEVYDSNNVLRVRLGVW